MGLFNPQTGDSSSDGGGLNVDLDKVLAVTGGALLGASGQLEEQPEPETDWTPIVIVAGVGLAFLVLFSARR